MHDTTEPPILRRIRDSLIGADATIEGPWGPRRVTYADYTASGRSLSFIEDAIRDRVLPLYANTHTETSATGRYTTRLRESARETVKRACGAGDDVALIFCGSGSTAAVAKLIDVLGLRVPAGLEDRYGLTSRIPAEERPVVFIGPYEHHSNELPWRESIADVVCVPEDAEGRIDAAALERELLRHGGRPLRIGSFSAASNVTGILSDVAGLTALLHRHGALAFWDYAAAAPYVPIRMDGSGPQDRLDAVFLSPHKLVGGPGTPGILLARRGLCRNRVPAMPGGGTVEFVTEHEHRYLTDPEHREEGGTPGIVESIRAGLAFAVKEAVGTELIRAREHELKARALERWGRVPEIEILGRTGVERLGILSLRVRHGDRFLHHEFVAALLNDLFGIQARAGCSCAGPYGARLLGLQEPRVLELLEVVHEGWQGIKPGWIRISLNYFLDDAELDFLLDAVTLVATEGWRLLPAYAFDPRTGRWTHREFRESAPPRVEDLLPSALGGTGARPGTEPARGAPAASTDLYARYLAEGRRVLEAADPAADPAAREGPWPEAFERLRWFVTADEVTPGAGVGAAR